MNSCSRLLPIPLLEVPTTPTLIRLGLCNVPHMCSQQNVPTMYSEYNVPNMCSQHDVPNMCSEHNVPDTRFQYNDFHISGALCWQHMFPAQCYQYEPFLDALASLGFMLESDSLTQ